VHHELVHHIELRHFLKDFDKTGSRVALEANEQQPGIKFHLLPPWRPPLSGRIGTIIV